MTRIPYQRDPDFSRPLLEIDPAVREHMLGRLAFLYGAEAARAAMPELERVLGLLRNADLSNLGSDNRKLALSMRAFSAYSKGAFLEATLLRRIGGEWFAGINGRYFDNTQEFSATIGGDKFRYDKNLRTSGIGLDLQCEGVCRLFETTTNSERTWQHFMRTCRSVEHGSPSGD